MILLKDYIAELQKVAETHPSFGELPVIYAEDDEGNGYQLVSNLPSLFSVVDIKERNLEPDLGTLQKAQQGLDTESKDFKKLNCVIVN
jgi:hypothetical protein